jgi:hypothetical protein
VAVADLGGGAVIATVDGDDLRDFAAHAKGVVVASIQAGASVSCAELLRP